MRTCRKNFWARTIAFTNQTHWGHSSGTGEHPHQCTSPKWMLLFVSRAFLSAHFKTHTYFCYLIILLWFQINESLSLCFAYVSNQNTLNLASPYLFFSCYTITYKLNYDKLMIVYLFNTQKWIFVRRVNLISDNSAIMQLCCVQSSFQLWASTSTEQGSYKGLAVATLSPNDWGGIPVGE